MDGAIAVKAAEKHVAAIRSWLWTRCMMSSREGDDILQECLVSAWRQGARGRFPVDAAAQLEWMRRVAQRAVYHRLRGLRASGEQLVDHDELEGLVLTRTVADDYEEAERVRLLRNVMAELACQAPELYRTAVCRWVDDLEVWQIAQICGVPENTVWNRLRLVRERLGEILARRAACEAGQLERLFAARAAPKARPS